MDNNTNNNSKEKAIFFQSIVDNVPNMIFVKEAKELRFIVFNKAGEELLGYTTKEMIGKNDTDFFPKEQADSFMNNDRVALKNKTLVDTPEESIQTRKKGLRILHTKKIPIMDENGEPKYLLGISEDITERKNLELKVTERAEELAERVEELEALNKIMTDRELKMVELKKEIENLRSQIKN